SVRDGDPRPCLGGRLGQYAAQGRRVGRLVGLDLDLTVGSKWKNVMGEYCTQAAIQRRVLGQPPGRNGSVF
ncbi:MAG: hypothetical protein ACRDRX_09315, partial [Pseudonocardiaceae bacterium]